MIKLNKIKLDKYIIISLLLFIVISLISINSASILLNKENEHLVLKQTLWYLVGFGLIFVILKIKNNWIYNHIEIFYVLFNILLLLLLFCGKEINNAKCWFSLPGIGTFQPSEFMKIILIIMIGKTINKFNIAHVNPTVKEEFCLLVKVGIITLIPTIITFLEPDTGVVLIYFIILLVMLFISGVRYRWFIIFVSLILIFLSLMLFLYKFEPTYFIKIFGSSFFLRINRLLDWSNQSGYQLSNGLITIGSSGLIGNGINNTPLYFPEAHTDFIFAVISSNFGLLGGLALFIIIAFFDIRLIVIAIKSDKLIDKYIISGCVGMLIYQQFQNIGMTYGLLPITGITLPFISYGGSSLLSYMAMIGIILNISNEQNKKNKA